MMIRVLAIATALALPSVALADPDKAPDKTNEKMTDKAPVKTDKDAKLADGDVKIIAHVHHVNQMEIDMGKLAQKSGTQVR